MMKICADLKEKFSIKGIKAEFEDEGLSLDDVLEQKSLADKIEIDFAIKIGGAGALNDIKNAKRLNIKNIIAPMIESEYALKKFVKAVKSVYGDEKVNLFINIETKGGINSLDEILNSNYLGNLKGIVLRRSDLACSFGFEKKNINGNNILEITKYAAKRIKEKGLKFIIGGGITTESLKFLSDLGCENFDYFETRKIIFNSDVIKMKNIEDGISAALEFEIMCLKSVKHMGKAEYLRIKKLEENIKKIPAKV